MLKFKELKKNGNNIQKISKNEDHIFFLGDKMTLRRPQKIAFTPRAN